MALIEDGRVVADRWRWLADGEPLPAAGAVILPYERWLADRPRPAPGLQLGTTLPAGKLASTLAESLADLSLVAVGFAKFRDGRGFSAARELRERYGFEGEIRAVGHLVADQYIFLHRCGFSTVTIEREHDAPTWAAALSSFTVAYQAAAEGDRPLSQLRRRIGAGR